MLTIRLQRLGRKGHPTYRVVVQDSRQSPTSGKYVALLGNYDPHSKKVNLAKEKAELYLKNGAQPSERIVSLFNSEGVELPSWVKQSGEKSRSTRNPDKLRKNQPASEKKPEEPAGESSVEPEAVTEKAPEVTVGEKEVATEDEK
jgi:small subunit ribosomal protein S16